MRILLFFILFFCNDVIQASCESSLSLFLKLSNNLEYTPRPPKVREHIESGYYLSTKEVTRIVTSQYGGAYIYLIDTEGRIMYAPRFNYIHDTGNVISTHASLLNRIRQVTPEDKSIAPVAMAGEFYITAERVSRFNNKSGRWRGDEQHLQEAVNVFREQGFTIDDSIVVNYTASNIHDISHSSEHALAIKYERIMHDVYLEEKFQKMVGLYDRLYKRYPLNDTGEIDYKRVIKDMKKFYDSNSLEYLSDLAQLVFLISDSYRDAGGFLYTFFHLYETNTLDKVFESTEKILSVSKPTTNKIK